MADLLLQAMNARQRGDIKQTKQILAQALIQDPHNESAWMMMSEVVDDIKLKRTCLQKVLLINPENSAANLALMKLDTAPLGPIERGERNKPLVPPKITKAPPFTPPFTWSGDDAQFQALGEMTYPNMPEEELNKPTEQTATFDWAAESSEPDKTIDRIFEAVSNPEVAVDLPPNPVLSWMEGEPAPEPGVVEALFQVPAEPGEPEAGIEAGGQEAPDAQPPAPAEEPAQAEPQAEAEAAAAEVETGPEPVREIDQAEPLESEPLLWDNPKAKLDRLVIMGSTYIIFANPTESDMPHILGLFNEKKMLRDLLGNNAGTIKMETIKRVTINPKRADLRVEYRQDGKKVSHPLTFSSPQVRDEALEAIQQRLGTSYTRRIKTYNKFQRVFLPLLVITLIMLVGWFLISGVGLLENLAAFQTGAVQSILSSLRYFVDLVTPFNILLTGLAGILVCLIWLIVNLTKPAELVIVEPVKSKKKRI